MELSPFGISREGGVNWDARLRAMVVDSYFRLRI